METNYNPSGSQKLSEPDEARYLHFHHLSDDETQDGKLRLNRYSSILTRDHNFPGAKVRVQMPSGLQRELKEFPLLSMIYKTLMD